MASVPCPLHLMDEMSYLCAPSHNRIVTELYICHPHRQRIPGGQKSLFFSSLCLRNCLTRCAQYIHVDEQMSKSTNKRRKGWYIPEHLWFWQGDHWPLPKPAGTEGLGKGDEPRVGNAVLSLSWNKRQSCLHTLGAHQTHSDGRWKDTSAGTSSDSSTSRTPEIAFLFFLPPAGVKEWVSAHYWYFSLGYFTLEWTFLLRK